MERYFVGLDVSKDETGPFVKGSDGRTAVALKKPTDPDAIATAATADRSVATGGAVVENNVEAGPRGSGMPASDVIPGVGAVSAVTFVATIDDPARFRSSRSVGAYIGLTSRRYQSGEMAMADASPAEETNGCEPSSSRGREQPALSREIRHWASIERLGHGTETANQPQKAVVALARKLSVILHAIWRDGTTFEMKGVRSQP